MSQTYFSNSYAEARQRFKTAAEAVGASTSSYPIDADCQDELAIDVAILGADNAPTIITSSGVHGVEGFFGSAVQLALLDQLRASGSRSKIRHVLIHALNPFGFSQLRRFNEDNIDLNRNFLADATSYRGAPDGYARLNRLLNPESPPSRFEPFKLKTLWAIYRYGLQPLKQAVAGGQYQYPRGIFFGGKEPCQSTQTVYEHCDSWLQSAERILHIDFHTGLGAYGNYRLLLAESKDSESISWYNSSFGNSCVEPLDRDQGTAYKISGLFGAWMQQHFASREYRFVGAEFGTYDIFRVLSALRAENRAHHYGVEDTVAYRTAKEELFECFCPEDVSWRQRVVASGLNIVAQGAQELEK